MSAAGIIAILILGSLITTLFTYVFRNKGPWNSVWSFLLVQILCLSVVTIWAPPVGPVWYGTPWIDLFITSFFVASIMAAFTPSANEFRSNALSNFNQKQRMSLTTDAIALDKTTNKDKTVIAAGSFLWMLLLFLTVLIIAGAVA